MNKKIVIIVSSVLVLIIALILFLLLSKKEIYTVTFMDENNKLTEQKIEKGDLVSKPLNPRKEGYNFQEWQLNGVAYDFSMKVENNFTLMAKWVSQALIDPVTVSFDTDGGNTITSIDLERGNKIEEPENPKKIGYEFTEWQLNNEKFDFTKEITENITLKAIYKEKMLTVTYDTDGGNNIKQSLVQEGKKLTKPKDPTKAGYEFVEWMLDDQKYDFDTELTYDITLKATWIKVTTYKVKFDTDGGSSIKEIDVKENTQVAKPTNPTKEGYELEKWQLNGNDYDFSSKVTEDITLKAIWKKIITYTVTYDTDGGSNINSETVKENSVLKEPTNPTKTNYRFVKWQLDGVDYKFTEKVTKNITLKAIWEEIVTYTVTFNTDGGTTIPSIQVEKNDKVTKPTNPTRANYKFVKWQLDGVDYNFTENVTKNITLTAIWEEIIKYQVIFDTDGGSSIPSKIIDENGKVSKPTNPTKANNKFVKWQLDGVDYNFDTPVTKNITLKAIWEEITTYTVTFSSGTNNIPSQNVENGQKATNPGTPNMKTGHTFGGWELNNSEYDFNTPVTANITLTGKWIQKSYTVIAEKNDEFSTDYEFIVKEENNEITSYKRILKESGTELAKKGEPLAFADIKNITNVLLEFNDGVIVNADFQIR